MSYAKRHPILRRLIAGPLSHKEIVIDKDGNSINKTFDDCGPLPDPSKFKLEYQLATGVSLQECPTRLVGGAGMMLETAASIGLSPDDFVNE